MKAALASLITMVALIACAPHDVELANAVAYELSVVKRCTEFDVARAKAHARLHILSEKDIRRLVAINKSGRVICNESIQMLTEEIEQILARSS